MKEFDVIKDMIYDEIAEIGHRGQLNKETVCVLGEMVDILKDIGSVEMFEEGINIQDDDYYFANNGGYSQRRMPVYYSVGNSYRDGQGGNSNQPRRSMRGYSREDGKEHIIRKLEGLMNEVVDQQDKDAIQKLIHQMNN